jgi:hypothetical protein
VTTPPALAQPAVDSEHLRILSLVHYVFGGLCALLSCVLIIHFVIGVVMLVNSQSFGNGPQGPPAFMGVFFILFSSCFMVLGWLLGGLTIYSGVCMKRRQHRTFSLIVAAINCLSIPFGTALGVFTIIVLSRPSVKELYEQPAA